MNLCGGGMDIFQNNTMYPDFLVGLFVINLEGAADIVYIMQGERAVLPHFAIILQYHNTKLVVIEKDVLIS